jgi:hypothetical protein
MLPWRSDIMSLTLLAFLALLASLIAGSLDLQKGLGSSSSSDSAHSCIDADFDGESAAVDVDSRSVHNLYCTAETIEAALAKAFHLTGAHTVQQHWLGGLQRCTGAVVHCSGVCYCAFVTVRLHYAARHLLAGLD